MNITPFLWFDHNAREAVDFYASVFRQCEILDETPMIITFRVANLELMALNGGPHFTFNEAISLFVDCETQEEVDEYWNKLAEAGQPGQCGWIRDRFGLWWQIVPKGLRELLADPNPEKAKRAMDAMLKMSKLDIAELRRASES